MAEANAAEMGKVKNQDKPMVRKTRVFAVPTNKPIPAIEPTDTCVVDTGIPNLLAKITKNPVTKLAITPWLGSSLVTF